MPRCLSSLRMTWSFKCLVFCQGLISITLLTSQWHGPIYVDLCDTHFRVSVSICDLVTYKVGSLKFCKIVDLEHFHSANKVKRKTHKLNILKNTKSKKRFGLFYSMFCKHSETIFLRFRTFRLLTKRYRLNQYQDINIFFQIILKLS